MSSIQQCANPSKRLSVVGILIVALFTLSACGGAAAPTATPASEGSSGTGAFTIGLAVSNLANPFFATLKSGAEEAGRRLNVTIVTVDAADDAARQSDQIKSLIDQKVSAMLVNPVDSNTVGGAVEAANAANIPVFTVDRSAAGGVVVAHIASDNLNGGRMAGSYLADILGGKGSVVELKGIEGTSAAQQRGAGFNQAISGFPDITLIASETASFSREEGKTVFAGVLTRFSDIDAVFAHNDEMILGAIEAAREAGRLADIRFVGFDAVDDALAALEKGELLATIAQQPAEMGRLGVETAVKYLNKESVAASIPVDLALITR